MKGISEAGSNFFSACAFSGAPPTAVFKFNEGPNRTRLLDDVINLCNNLLNRVSSAFHDNEAKRFFMLYLRMSFPVYQVRSDILANDSGQLL